MIKDENDGSLDLFVFDYHKRQKEHNLEEDS